MFPKYNTLRSQREGTSQSWVEKSSQLPRAALASLGHSLSLETCPPKNLLSGPYLPGLPDSPPTPNPPTSHLRGRCEE